MQTKHWNSENAVAARVLERVDDDFDSVSN